MSCFMQTQLLAFSLPSPEPAARRGRLPGPGRWQLLTGTKELPTIGERNLTPDTKTFQDVMASKGPASEV